MIRIMLAALLMPVAASANVILQTPQVTLTLEDSNAWTMRSLTVGGRAYSDDPSSGQGTVATESGIGWVGSVHGGESVLSTSLLVNGSPAAFADGNTYTGSSIRFTRHTAIGSIFLLTSTVDVGSDRITETVTLERTGAVSSGIVYGFLGSRSNRLTQAAGFDTSGLLVSQATTASGDGAMPSLSPAVAVAQYDPIGGDGILSTITAGDDLGLEHFIWDRPGDNKLYARFHGIQGVHPEGTTFTIQQTMRFFEADGDTWQAVAGAMVPEPAAILPLLGLIGLARRRRH